MRRTSSSLLIVMLILALHWSSPAQEVDGYQIVVHPNNPSSSMTKKQVSKIFLKSTSRWDHGVLCEPVDQTAKSPVRRTFSKDVHNRSASSVKSYWQHQIFSGGKAPPPELGSDADVLAWVSSHEGGIGYVSAGASVDGVKVLTLSD